MLACFVGWVQVGGSLVLSPVAVLESWKIHPRWMGGKCAFSSCCFLWTCSREGIVPDSNSGTEKFDQTQFRLIISHLWKLPVAELLYYRVEMSGYCAMLINN